MPPIDYKQEFPVASNIAVEFNKVRDWNGFLVDTCDVVVTKENGHLLRHAMFPPQKFELKSMSDPIFSDSTTVYTMDDALEVYEKWSKYQ